MFEKGLRSLLGGWFLLVLVLQSACVGAPRGRTVSAPEPGLERTLVYEAEFVEPGPARTRPVPLQREAFQQAFRRLAWDVRLAHKSPREAASEWLRLLPGEQEAPWVSAQGDWNLEQYGGRGYTFLPERQEGAVVLTPLAEAALKEQYLRWCARQEGGDCLGLLDDGDFLRAEDRRTLALALAFGSVLDETRAALGRELNARAVVSLVVWTVALYCMMWVVPEPTTKALAAALTVLLMGWLGLETVYGLMDGWAGMANAAHEATTFEELRAAGAAFGKVMGEDAARAMILGVATLAGRTLGEVTARVTSLPGYRLAGAQWEAQGGAAALGSVEAAEMALTQEGALASAIAAVETVATSPQGPLAVVMLKKGSGGGTRPAPGGRFATTVLRHRGGNQQVELSDGQRWHLPRGKSVADIPAQDKVGDQLQDAVTRAAKEWGPHRLSFAEKKAIQKASAEGEYWLARLLEREARGRYVQTTMKRQFQHLYDFDLNKGVDIVDSASGLKYEILSGTESNLARHGKRMMGEFFRMLTF